MEIWIEAKASVDKKVVIFFLMLLNKVLIIIAYRHINFMIGGAGFAAAH